MFSYNLKNIRTKFSMNSNSKQKMKQPSLMSFFKPSPLQKVTPPDILRTPAAPIEIDSDEDVPIKRKPNSKVKRIREDNEDEENVSPVFKLPLVTPKRLNYSGALTSELKSASSLASSRLEQFQMTPTYVASSPYSIPSTFDKKKERTSKFKDKNEERYSWLDNPTDSERRSSEDPDYDCRTLFVPAAAWNGFTAFERQFWEIKSKHWYLLILP